MVTKLFKSLVGSFTVLLGHYLAILISSECLELLSKMLSLYAA